MAAAGLLSGLAATMSRAGALALVVGLIVLAGLLTGGDSGSAVRAVAEARVNLASPDRTGALHAALRLVAQQPMTGTGPGHADLRWKGQDHGTQLFAYVHNEYLQVTAELALVGLALLAVLLASIAHLLWRARPTGRGGTTWAGVAAAAAAFAVHSGFDFVWHLPAVVLTVTLLVGAALPSVPIQEEEPDENQTAH